ncbi:hypothetical protein [Simiduia agarivorans]|uniref:Uncharacterized protein n=1 Tax=Simiduia agarivorans (strain DSM 21679 / JCM 13881 / BCRC 17597 / SA1) TaxID=1117647 RepID=R9S588_SIMAS|nr:hypothetical protein [Simiduia agarivorans]AGN11326.1 hypothetical protein M5M_11887 [Simiduia agarivorans SA1 = DSM 21679]
MDGKFNRLYWLIGGLTALVLLQFCFVIYWLTNDQLRVKALHLVDDGGTPRGQLQLSAGGAPELLMLDESGEARIKLTYANGDAGLYLFDEQGTHRIGIAQFAHGGGGVALHGKNARGALVLYLKNDNASLRVFDTEGQVVDRFPAKAE